MRIAIVSDIHGNLAAFEAVLADLRRMSPDVVLHGGDLADGGSSPAEVVDRVRDLGWEGVYGNTDEVHFNPRSLDQFVRQSKAPAAIWDAVRETTAATHAMLGEERIAWLGRLPRVLTRGPLALVHASPDSAWSSPVREASDADWETVYAPLGKPLAVYGHIHTCFVRNLAAMTVANSGSVSLSYDGDPRASYLLADDGSPEIRRVEYDVDREIAELTARRFPRADWMARTLRAARPQMP